MTEMKKDSKKTDVIDVQTTMDQYSGRPDPDKMTADFIDAPVSMINQEDFESISEKSVSAAAVDIIDVPADMDPYTDRPDSDKITADFIDAPVSMINQEDFDKIKK